MTNWRVQLQLHPGKEWWAIYNQYLKSADWRDKRLACLRRDNYACVVCGETRSLQVHHKTYARAGGESLNDLTTLCKPCHKIITIMLRDRRTPKPKHKLTWIERILGLLT